MSRLALPLIVVVFTLVATLLTLASNIQAGAATCAITAGEPYVLTVHSGRAAPPGVGERLIIVAGVTSGCNSHLPLTGIVQVRDSNGITEFINQQTIKLDNQTAGIGASWVPLHYGIHQLRFFAIDSLSNPQVVSNIAVANLTVKSYQPSAAISILPEPYQPNERPDFLPENITVVIGVNNTVSWTNGDTVSHVLVGQQVSVGNQVIRFSPFTSVNSDFSTEYTFTSPGLYEYKDKDHSWMHGFIQVLPEPHKEQVNIAIPEGSNIGNGPNYMPQLVRVVIGHNNTVTWTNNSNETNGVWADNQDDFEFYSATLENQSNIIQPHKSFTYTFRNPGIIQYHGHAYLSGTVIVLAADNRLEYNFYDGEGKVPSNQVIRQNYTGLKQDTGIVTIANQTFYMRTLNETSGVLQFGSEPFHGIQFSFPNGEINTPGGSFIVLQVDFPDGSEEVFGKEVKFEDGRGYGSGIGITPIGPSNMWNVTATTILTSHKEPQAGITVIPGQGVKFLVSTS